MPAQVDFAEPQRVGSHLSGAWKEPLIKDAGGYSNLACIMPDFYFHWKIHVSRMPQGRIF